MEMSTVFITQLLQLMLKKNYQVKHASSGEMGLHIFADVHPSIVVFDTTMPDMKAVEFIERLRQHPDSASVPCVVLSSRSDPEEMQACLQAGCAEYYVKSGSVMMTLVDSIPRYHATPETRLACDEELKFRVAGVREAFEECGILLAHKRGHRELIGAADLAPIEKRWRDKLARDEASIVDLVEAEDLEVDEAAPANGTFDAGDKIIVFVESWAERSGATLPQRVWGDAEVIYATRVARAGRRIDSSPGWLDLVSPTPLPSYPWTQRWESNIVYLSSPGTAPAESTYDQFHWTSVVPYYSRPENTFEFETNHLDPTRAIQFTIGWQGRRNGVGHYVWGQVRNGDFLYTPVADSVTFSGKANFTVTSTLPGEALTEGRAISLA